MRYSLTHLPDQVLCQNLTVAAANERGSTAELIAHIAEFDARKLYLPAAYESMLAYCVGELKLSEDAAKKRIRAARAGLRFPSAFEALADGRIHLSGLVLLSAHLTPENAAELLAAATRKTRDEIERLVAERFPRSGMESRVEPIAPVPQALAVLEGAPGPLSDPVKSGEPECEGAPGHPYPHARISPLSAHAFAVQFTRDREADERFRYLQDLLGHQVARGDIAEIYDRAVLALIEKMERVRFGACKRPRAGTASMRPDSRHVPQHVKRAVWQRDGGQCTFVSQSGRRCEAHGDVEFDHVKEVARGGETTVAGLQLRCRPHNQYTAERMFGAGFMKQKRAEAAATRASAKATAVQRRAERERRADESMLKPHELEVLPWLHELGCDAVDSRDAATRCRDMADAPLEERVKRALTWFGDRCGRKVAPVGRVANTEPPVAAGAGMS